jgi:dsDNA-specific endonuclease/ATPase MutS2
MANRLKVGDKVSFLSETGHGTILEIQNNQAKVEDESGFLYWYTIDDLVAFMSVTDQNLFETKFEKFEDIPKPRSKENNIQEQTEEWKIDLHMENLVDYHGLMTNHEIVLTQLSHFNKFLKEAEKARINKMIVIHGVGSGKLKAEIKSIVQGIKGAEMYDADYQKNGAGASIIERKYNVR